jgi:hypothetical protein
MALAFPNSSRSYDPDHKCIRFVGYDGMFQVFFSITVAAISEKRFDADGEEMYLKLFDSARAAIYGFAMKTYARTKKNSYSFGVADLDLRF